LVSIGIPVYRNEKYIKRCAESLFNQTYTNIEYVFVDDTPDDDKTFDILEQFCSQFPQRKIVFVRNGGNKGIGYSRNKILDTATGEFLLWVDSDDWLEKDAVECLVEAQKANNVDIVIGDLQIHYPSKVEYRKHKDYADNVALTVDMLDLAWQHCKLIRLSLYNDHHIRTTEINYAEDYQLMSKVSYWAKGVCNVHKGLYHVNRIGEASASSAGLMDKERRMWQMKQAEESHNVAFEFFKDKGQIYVDAINIANAKTLYGRVRHKYHATKEDWKEIRNYQKYKKSSHFNKWQKIFYSMPLRGLLNLYMWLTKIRDRKVAN